MLFNSCFCLIQLPSNERINMCLCTQFWTDGGLGKALHYALPQ